MKHQYSNLASALNDKNDAPQQSTLDAAKIHQLLYSHLHGRLWERCWYFGKLVLSFLHHALGVGMIAHLSRHLHWSPCIWLTLCLTSWKISIVWQGSPKTLIVDPSFFYKTENGIHVVPRCFTFMGQLAWLVGKPLKFLLFHHFAVLTSPIYLVFLYLHPFLWWKQKISPQRCLLFFHT